LSIFISKLPITNGDGSEIGFETGEAGTLSDEGGAPMFRRRHTGGSVESPPSLRALPARHGGPEAVGIRYRMVEKLASVGDDFFIQDDMGQRVVRVDGKALRMRDLLVFRDMQGNEICKILQRATRVRDVMEIQGPAGQRAALVTRAMITPLRDRFVVKIGNGADLEVRGNILSHEYRIDDVAAISKTWFRLRGSYGVEVAPGHDDVIILAVTVCIDQMTNDLA
jgi:uncharacterized protein YxjI